MTWTEVAERLAVARASGWEDTTASGAPHAAPVWGVVTGETLYLYSERSTVNRRTSRPTRGWSCTWKAARWS